MRRRRVNYKARRVDSPFGTIFNTVGIIDTYIYAMLRKAASRTDTLPRIVNFRAH